MLISFITGGSDLIIKGRVDFKYTRGERGIYPDLLGSGSHRDVWDRWSRGIVFNTTPTRVQPNGAPWSLSSSSCFTCRNSPLMSNFEKCRIFTFGINLSVRIITSHSNPFLIVPPIHPMARNVHKSIQELKPCLFQGF